MHYNGDFLSLPHLEESHWVIQWWKFICVMKRMNNTNGKKMETFLHHTGHNTCRHTHTCSHTHRHTHTHTHTLTNTHYTHNTHYSHNTHYTHYTHNTHCSFNTHYT